MDAQYFSWSNYFTNTIEHWYEMKGDQRYQLCESLTESVKNIDLNDPNLVLKDLSKSIDLLTWHLKGLSDREYPKVINDHIQKAFYRIRFALVDKYLSVLMNHSLNMYEAGDICTYYKKLFEGRLDKASLPHYWLKTKYFLKAKDNVKPEELKLKYKEIFRKYSYKGINIYYNYIQFFLTSTINNYALHFPKYLRSKLVKLMKLVRTEVETNKFLELKDMKTKVSSEGKKYLIVPLVKITKLDKPKNKPKSKNKVNKPTGKKKINKPVNQHRDIRPIREPVSKPARVVTVKVRRKRITNKGD